MRTYIEFRFPPSQYKKPYVIMDNVIDLINDVWGIKSYEYRMSSRNYRDIEIYTMSRAKALKIIKWARTNFSKSIKIAILKESTFYGK